MTAVQEKTSWKLTPITTVDGRYENTGIEAPAEPLELVPGQH